MDHHSKLKTTLLAAAALILAIPLLSAFSIEGNTLGAFGSSITTTTLGSIGDRLAASKSPVCHATGDPANPYEELSVNSAELNKHLGHANDIYPVPANGCPASTVLTSDGKITICHATGSQNNPYNEINVSVNGLNGHDGHEGDIIPAPEEGCPASLVLTSAGEITICHATGSQNDPYDEITVSVDDLDGHDGHAGDIIAVPEGGCPESLVFTNNGEITICHATGSQNNPYDEITVSVDDLDGHDGHSGDIIPAQEGSCPSNSGSISNRFTDVFDVISYSITNAFGSFGNNTSNTPLVTSCHFTGDLTNPYEVITITHDISPVPANGCPKEPVFISEGMITICHATGNENNPYDEISVSLVGLNGHGSHEADVFPSSEGSCPASSSVLVNPPSTTTTTTTTQGSFGNRFTTTWVAFRSRITTFFGAFGNNNNTTTATTTSSYNVCHATDNPANPYEELTAVNDADLNVHLGHANDIYPVPVNGCPTSQVISSDGKITICHMTGSQKNPYNEITVSVNGLNGHDGHAGDIIPAPAGGCPDSPQGNPQGKKPNNGNNGNNGKP